jgi:zinc D-Ala-D-Ala carboxypeptidase
MNTLNAQNPADSLTLDIRKVGRDFKLSRNFTLGEFASKDGDPIVLVHPAIIIALQTLRDHLGKPIHINSGYRSSRHNVAIGGASKSMHTLGMAADIVVSGKTPIEIASLAHDMGLGGIKAYPSFTHIDVGVRRTW